MGRTKRSEVFKKLIVSLMNYLQTLSLLNNVSLGISSSFVIRPVSILRAKLGKVFTKYKILMFLAFVHFFQQCRLLWL